MATGLVNGKWQISTFPHRIDSLKRSSKNCHMWLRWQPLQLCQIWCKSLLGVFWANGWNNPIFLFMPFFGNSPTGQTSRRFFTLDGSNDADSRKDVFFGGGVVDIAPNFEGEIPQNPNFGAVNRQQCVLLPNYFGHLLLTALVRKVINRSSPSVFTLSFKPLDLRPWLFAYVFVRLMAIARWRLKIKIMGEGKRLELGLATMVARSVWPRSAT